MTQIRFAVRENNHKRLDYTSTVGVYELFPDSFMKKFTKHKNFTDFFEAIGCDLTSQTDLTKLQESNAFDSMISSCSEFESWQDMCQTAYQQLLDET